MVGWKGHFARIGENMKAFKNTIVQAFTANEGIEVRDIDKNLYSFRFFSKERYGTHP